MLLAIDIGNTNITLGVFDGDCLINKSRIKTECADYKSQLQALCRTYAIDACAIVSVVDELTQSFKGLCDSVFGVNSFIFNYSNANLKIALPNPEKVGADRLVDACAVIEKYQLPVIIVDVGTAITVDVVSKDKEFLGGAIMPGVNLQFQALNQYTSKLPVVHAGISNAAIGKNTESAMLSGVMRGIAGAVEGLIKQCEFEIGENAAVIATGGQCSMITEYMGRKFDYINPDLTLDGLRLAYSNSHVNLY